MEVRPLDVDGTAWSWKVVSVFVFFAAVPLSSRRLPWRRRRCTRDTNCFRVGGRGEVLLEDWIDSVLTGGAEKYFWMIGSDWLDEVLAGGREELLLEDCLDVRFFSMAPPF